MLGRYNAEITETHYGRPHVEVLFGEYPALAQQYLHEAEERWEQMYGEQGNETETVPDMNMTP